VSVIDFHCSPREEVCIVEEKSEEKPVGTEERLPSGYVRERAD
jgi:hypothetical protein